MFIFISSFISINVTLFMYIILISAQKNKTDEERYLEDIIQMEYLRNYQIKHCKK